MLQINYISIKHFTTLNYNSRIEKKNGCLLNITNCGTVVKNLPASEKDTGDVGLILGREDPLE